MKTEGLPWHADLLRELSTAHANEQLPHALALTAPPGWGLIDLAEQLVRTLLNLSNDQPIQEIAHPDLHWMEPDGAVHKIKPIRDARDYAVQTPQIAGFKVIVLVQAELLNIASANALLKTLEEPPPNTYVVLCTENWGRLLPTIRSRCQRIQIRCTESAALAWLDSQGCNTTPAEFALAGYAPLSALEQYHVQFATWVERVASRGLDAASNDLPDDLGAWLALWYRHVVKCLSASFAAAADADPAREYGIKLVVFSAEILTARRQIMSGNIRTKVLLVERLAYLWQQIHRDLKV